MKKLIFNKDIKEASKIANDLLLQRLNNPPDVLLSIKSKFVDKIKDGSKIIEIRKKFTEKPINVIYVYSSERDKNVSGVITKFIVQKIDINTYTKESLLECACITEEELIKYAGNKEFYIIHILKYIDFSNPLSLESLYNLKLINSKNPPQNFSFFNNSLENSFVNGEFLDTVRKGEGYYKYIEYIGDLKIKNAYELEISNYYNKEKLNDFVENKLLSDKEKSYQISYFYDFFGNIKGFVAFHEKEKEIKINTFYLFPEYRNLGKGVLIFLEFLNRIKKNLLENNKKLTMYISKKLECNFYISIGFKIIEEDEENYYLEYSKNLEE